MTQSNGSNKANIASAYEAIKNAIIRQELQPGTWLREQMLCRTLGLGRSSIRNALQILASEGYVTLIPNRGARIVSFTKDQLGQLLSVKTEMEKFALSLSYSSYTKENLAYLEQLVREEQAAVENSDFRTYLEIIFQFYGYIVDKAGNEYLSAAFQMLNNRYTVYLALYDAFYQVPSGKSLSSAKYHRKLLACIERGNLTSINRSLDSISEWVLRSYSISPSNMPIPR